MIKKKVSVTSPSFSSNAILREELSCLFERTLFNDSGINIATNNLAAFIGDSDAAIIGLEKIDSMLIKNCSRLRVISKYGVGLNNIDLKAALAHKVEVMHTPGVNKRSVAELALGYMLGVSRNIFNSVINMRSGMWIKDGGFELSGKKIGIIGYGNIGKDLAKLLKMFDVSIYVNDVLPDESLRGDKSIIFCSKEEIMRECDIISLHIPYNESTHHFIGKKEFQLIKEGGILINTSRGGIVDENSLLERLSIKPLYACLDVFEVEPQVSTQLINNKLIFPTPHIGGNSKEAVLAMGRAAIENLKIYYK